ncbi:molybdopterin-synthase adenylyltransferase MoeB [Angustibacter aerolatus]
MSQQPIVEPGPPLSAEQALRYDRHLLVPEVGDAGQRRLSAARVLVVGAGGLGSPVLLYLAAAGVGTIGLVDPDVVELSNLQRQVVHGDADVGRPKVDSAADALRAVNPLVEVVRLQERVGAGNALRLLEGWDVVVDGTDTFPSRYLVNDACAVLGLPLVWGSVLRFDGQVSVFWAGHGPCYRCVFPEPPPPGAVPSCSEAGVLGVVCASIGAAQAAEVVKLVTGAGRTLTGRLLVHDALAATWDELPLRRDPGCAVCGEAPTITRATGLHEVWSDRAAPPSDGLPVVDAAGLAAELAGAGPVPVVVDVREPDERVGLVVPGSVNVPVGRFDDGTALADVPFDRPVVLHCRSGARSARALRVLLDAGHPDARHLTGGVLAWAALRRD